MKTKKGYVFKINIGSSKVAFAQSLTEPEFTFFEESPIDTISTPFFRIWVHQSATIKWDKIGNKELAAELALDVPRFKNVLF